MSAKNLRKIEKVREIHISFFNALFLQYKK